jgi:triosephosphate isomerase
MQNIQRFILGCNFKMQGDTSFFQSYVHQLQTHLFQSDLVLFPPFPYLHLFQKVLRSPHFILGAQDGAFQEKGAFTGCVSMAMLKDVGVTHVLIGHSERRNHFGEQREILKLKIHRAIEQGLTPILCIGENASERDAGKTTEALDAQCCVLESLDHPFWVAYEPQWAIGTGLAPSSQEIAPVVAHLKGILPASAPILYGGSVDVHNAATLGETPGLSGFLLGKACMLLETLAIIDQNCT